MERLCVCVCVHLDINAVANKCYVMLQLHLRHEFYNIILKVKCILYTVSGSALPPPQINSRCTSVLNHHKSFYHYNHLILLSHFIVLDRHPLSIPEMSI